MTVDCLKYSISRVIHAAAIHSARHHGLHVLVVSCWADYRCVLYEGNPRHAFWVHVALDPCSHCLHHQLIAHMQTQLQACPFCRLLQQPRRTPSDLVVLVPLPACLFLKYATFASFVSATLPAWFRVRSFTPLTSRFARLSLKRRSVIIAILSFHRLNLMIIDFGSPFLLSPILWARAWLSIVNFFGPSTLFKTSIAALAQAS